MRRPISVPVMASLAAVAVLAGCGGNRAAAPPGLAPVDLGAAAVGFVGADVCKQCHSAAHAAWLTTKHHDALRFLAEVKQDRNPQCLPCHTVGFGKPGGYRSAQQTPHLANVQCESCHGAGARHIKDPSKNRLPVSLSADVCGQCHRASNRPTFQRWSASKHAQALKTLQGLSFANDSCLECHSAEAILAPKIVLRSRRTVAAKNAITCVVCHDPHRKANEAQLRRPPERTCTPCHTDEQALPGGTPHHPQREMLAGRGGRASNGRLTYGPNSAHATAVAEKCVQCHVYAAPVAGPSPDSPPATGHTFLPLVPAACRGCHPANSVLGLKRGVQALITGKLNELAPYFDKTSARYIDPAALSPDKRARYNIAKFDYDLVNGDASRGCHNRAYAEHLLRIAEALLASL